MKDGCCHIAIIDDGICLSSHDLPLLCYENFLNTEISEANTAHGSIVAQIIRKYNSECHISSLRVIDNYGNGDINNLVSAIKWCLANEVDVIHMSIGTTHFSDFPALQATIDDVLSMNITVVASQSNDCIFTLPACFDSVIGVRNSDECKPCEVIVQYNNWDGIDIVTSSRFTIKHPSGCVCPVSPSNSFASPYVTALVSKLIARHGKMNKDAILAHLELGAIRVKGKPAKQSKRDHGTAPLCYFESYHYKDGKYPLQVYKDITTPTILVDDGNLHMALINHFTSAGYNCYPIVIEEACASREQESLIQEDIQRFMSYIDIKYDPDMFVIFSKGDFIHSYDVKIALGDDIIISFSEGEQKKLPKNQINEMVNELSQYFV